MSFRAIILLGACLELVCSGLPAQAPKPFQSAPLQRSIPGGDLGISISTMMKDSWAFKGEVILLETALTNEEGTHQVSYVPLEEVSEPENLQQAQQWGNVPLTYFEATSLPIGVVIGWEAVGDASISTYELLKKEENQSWEVIGEVIASDSEDEIAAYQLVDVNAGHGIAYYCLRQRHHSGKEAQSQHIIVDRFEAGAQYTYVYPNPYLVGITLAFQLERPQPILIMMLNEADEIIAEMETQRASKGQHLIELDLSTLPKQAYYCLIKTGKHEQRIPLTEK